MLLPVSSISRADPTFSPSPLPLLSSVVRTGLPSPADDHLDLHQHVVKHPAATYFVRAEGDSMTGGGSHHGDLLVVNRSLEALSGRVIVIAVELVKRLELVGQRAYLRANNPAYRPIPLESRMVARSNELKELGFEVGTVQHLLSPVLCRKVILLSGNYALYGDMSQWVSEVLAGFSPHIEVYSIDESFVGFHGGLILLKSVAANYVLPLNSGRGCQSRWVFQELRRSQRLLTKWKKILISVSCVCSIWMPIA